MIKLTKAPVLLLFYLLLLSSCNFSGKNKTNTSLVLEFDSISVKLKYSETLFIIPSPDQTTILLKNCHLGFHPEILAPAIITEKFNTTFKKSLLLGVLGANISYLNLYQQKESAVKDLQKIQSILIDLEMDQSVDKRLIDNLLENFGNNDSVTYYLAELYRASQHILKSNERWDLYALVIAGGWIESFYFLTSLYDETKNEQLFEIILYQKEILNNLIKMLSPFYEKSIEYSEFIDGLINIAYEYDVIDRLSQTHNIQTDTTQQFTNVDNTTNFEISGSRLEGLYKIVIAVRNKIMN